MPYNKLISNKKKNHDKHFLSKVYIFIIENRGRLPYCKSLYKRKLISIKKWLQSTDYKKMAEVRFPFFLPQIN